VAHDIGAVFAIPVDGFFSFMVTQELVDVVTYSLTVDVQPTITAVAFEALLGV